MDLPCLYCPEMKKELFEPFEYGCENLCKKAKDYYQSLGCKIDALIDRLKEIG